MHAVVVGAGVLGLAAGLALADRGHRVTVLERHRVGHALGSSAGRSRTFRLAYAAAHDARLALRSQRAWRALGERCGEELLAERGQLEWGAPILGIAEMLTTLGIPHRVGGADELGDLFPELSLPPDVPILYHPEGASLVADRCLAAYVGLLADQGARLREQADVTAVEPTASGVRVVTAQETIEADVAVVSTGPWAPTLLAPLGIDLPLAPGIAQVTYLDHPELAGRPTFADWGAAHAIGLYGHAVPGVGYKIGFDAASAPDWKPDATDWGTDEDEERRALTAAAALFPDLDLRASRSERHPWTMTPDGELIVDRQGPVVYLAGCSGHAFKLAPALGEIAAALAENVDPGEDAGPLRLDRPSLSAPVVGDLGSAPITR